MIPGSNSLNALRSMFAHISRWHEKSRNVRHVPAFLLFPGTEVTEVTPVRSQSSVMSTCRTVDPVTALADKL